MPLRIAFFNTVDQASGAEQLIRKTVAGLNERGHDARLYVRSRHGSEPYLQPIPYLPGELKLEAALRTLTGHLDTFFPSTARLERDPWLRDADLWHFHNVHGHYVNIEALSGLSRARRIVISPVDAYLTTGYCPYPLDCTRFETGCGNCPQLDLPYPGISRDATAALWQKKRRAIREGKFHFLFHTDFLHAHYRHALAREGELKMAKLNYGVDTSIYRPRERVNRGKFVMGLFHSYVAEPRKGLLPLLQDLGGLAKRYPGQMEVLVVGRQSKQARALATPELSVVNRKFIASEEELAQALSLCDVLLYPTRAENLSLTCLNALASGVPVISTAIGGQPEAIRHGQNGYLVAAGSGNSGFLAAVEDLMRHPEKRLALSKNARDTALQSYDMAAYVDQLVRYYG